MDKMTNVFSQQCGLVNFFKYAVVLCCISEILELSLFLTCIRLYMFNVFIKPNPCTQFVEYGRYNQSNDIFALHHNVHNITCRI